LRPRPFEYYAPSTFAEALDLLSKVEDAKILAGGQSIITLMKLRLVAPTALIYISKAPELTHIREEDGELVIGALARHDQLANDDRIHRRCLLLAEAANLIADQQVRNRGTLGGSLAHADPAADLPTACTALGATIVAASKQGARRIKPDEFFRDYFTTALRPDEMIQEVRIPIPPMGGGAYLKLTKGHNDFAIVAAAAQLTVDNDLICKTASVVLGGVASTPIHAKETEAHLMGRKLDDQVIDESSEKASQSLNPPSDIRATSEFRLEMARIFTERVIRLAVRRIRGGA
jgi:carbon-monoxide dehydrogenase medium subunit